MTKLHSTIHTLVLAVLFVTVASSEPQNLRPSQQQQEQQRRKQQQQVTSTFAPTSSPTTAKPTAKPTEAPTPKPTKQGGDDNGNNCGCTTTIKDVTLYGEPQSATKVRIPAPQWGWYQQIDNFAGTTKYKFSVYAQATNWNDSGEGTYLGDVTVKAQACATTARRRHLGDQEGSDGSSGGGTGCSCYTYNEFESGTCCNSFDTESGNCCSNFNVESGSCCSWIADGDGGDAESGNCCSSFDGESGGCGDDGRRSLSEKKPQAPANHPNRDFILRRLAGESGNGDNGGCCCGGGGDWSGVPLPDICLDKGQSIRANLHIDVDLPRDSTGAVSFDPVLYDPTCCVIGQTCYIIVHAAIADYGDGCSSSFSPAAGFQWIKDTISGFAKSYLSFNDPMV